MLYIAKPLAIISFCIAAISMTTILSVAQSYRDVQVIYDFKIKVSGGANPSIYGTTNAPDGTKLYVELRKPLLPDADRRIAQGVPACGDINCFPATGPDGQFGATAVVQKGQFSTGRFSFQGLSFRPGLYTLQLSLSVDARTAPLEDLKKIGKPIFLSRIAVTANEDAFLSPMGCDRPRGIIDAC
jgi:hypothetical protein